jgi:hypothetical protein
MCGLIKDFFNGYVMGNLVDSTFNQMPAFSEMNEKPFNKTSAKVACIWAAVTAVGIATYANPFITSKVAYAACCTVGSLIAFPFLRPLYSNLKFHALAYHQLSLKRKLQCAAILALFIALQIGAVCLSAIMSTKKYIPISIALSNLTLNGILTIPTAIFNQAGVDVDAAAPSVETSPIKISSLKDYIRIQIGKEKEKIKELRFKTKKLDNFIRQHDDLKKLCEEEILAHPEYIACDVTKPKNIGDANENDLLTSLQCDAILLEHFLEERMRLIKRRTKILELFTELVRKRDEDRPNRVYQTVKAIESKPQVFIEEVD